MALPGAASRRESCQLGPLVPLWWRARPCEARQASHAHKSAGSASVHLKQRPRASAMRRSPRELAACAGGCQWARVPLAASQTTVR